MGVRRVTPQIVHAMVGTAGHVDHGKTALIQLLTGCDTDRLREEKERGLSIDLGFAPCQLPGRRLVGIVDVPGHRDFIRNMVAGAASMDVLVLVVAADDGIMPQTVEHMKIVKLLRTPRVLVAITKIDLVDAEMVELLREDVAAFTARMGFPDAPIVCVSNKTLKGLDEVRETLDHLVESVQGRPPDSRAFRMNVERVFTVRGYGTVATGMPISGEIRVGDKVELLPSGRVSSVRAIQTYKYEAEAAHAGACSALNLRDIEAEAVGRGMTVATPGVYRPTASAVVSIQNVSESVTLKRRSELKLHCGTSVVGGSVKLVGVDRLRPGETAFARVGLEEPVVLAAGDRYIVRNPSLADTVGGGTVLSVNVPEPGRKARRLPGRLERALDAARGGDHLGAELLAGRRPLLHAEELAQLTQRRGEAVSRLLREKEESGEIVDLGAGAWLAGARLDELMNHVGKALERHHALNKHTWGMTPAQICDLLGLGVKNFARLAELLCSGDRIAVKHGRLALASFEPAISEREMELKDRLLGRVNAAGVNAPARGDLMTELAVSESDMKLMTRLLVEEGMVAVLKNKLMSTEVYEECRGKLLKLFENVATVGIPAFRKATGLSRNLAVTVLEAFDSEGMTRRVEGGRVLAREARKGRLAGGRKGDTG